MVMAAVMGLGFAAQAEATYVYESLLWFNPYNGSGDTGGHASWYSAYALTETDWKEISGTDSVTAFATWLGKSYSANASEVVESAQALSGIYWERANNRYEQATSAGYGSIGNGVIVFMYQDTSNNKAYAIERSLEGDSWKVAFEGEEEWETKTLSWTAVTPEEDDGPQGVPEPTSGLLMLLGLAGLALRRKRA